VQDRSTRDPPSDKRSDTLPGPSDLGLKALQAIDVAEHRMVVEVSLYSGPQPLPDFDNWFVPALPKLLPYGFEFC